MARARTRTRCLTSVLERIVPLSHVDLAKCTCANKRTQQKGPVKKDVRSIWQFSAACSSQQGCAYLARHGHLAAPGCKGAFRQLGGHFNRFPRDLNCKVVTVGNAFKPHGFFQSNAASVARCSLPAKAPRMARCARKADFHLSEGKRCCKLEVIIKLYISAMLSHRMIKGDVSNQRAAGARFPR